jgi:hypothetical protein
MNEPRKSIVLNGAEIEGFRRIAAERDHFLREAQRLDQFMRRLVIEIVEHRKENPKGGWNLDLPNGTIFPIELPKSLVFPEPEPPLEPQTKSE